ncbi:thiamine biosynthesis protein [Leptolyngbya sp. 'hensonii']|uniref:ABC transporter substrate-binding protein n=1 Tax=Leptolyngbya sp. 'hensonii' TaxID=1922337 RepID=UPI00094FD4CF|nr:ABC transporter substrate-binding protein [Leptolyngbya sp. 'hensonii']OLP20369.1 thiamine biosynthesis protein [Leptolyngbya sp. 'hensonii']
MLKVSSWLRWIALAIVSLCLTIACSQQPTPNTPTTGSSPQSQPIVSATNNWVGYSGHHVAVGKDFFSQEGLKVQDLYFQSASEQITAFLAGKIDMGWFTSGDAVQMVAKDPTIKIIYLVDYSNGGDGILGRNIKVPQDVKGKTVGRENILFERILLQAYLQKGGLTEQDVVIKDLAAADAAAAFTAKQVDVAVTYEPFLSQAVKQGGGEVIFSTKDTNLIADVVVVREKFLQERKADIKAYFRAVDKAVKLLNSGDAEALKISGTKLGVTGDEVKEQLTGVKLFDLEGNKSIGFNKSNPQSLIGNLELTAKGAYDFKIVPQPMKAESLYDDSVVMAS